MEGGPWSFGVFWFVAWSEVEEASFISWWVHWVDIGVKPGEEARLKAGIRLSGGSWDTSKCDIFPLSCARGCSCRIDMTPRASPRVVTSWQCPYFINGAAEFYNLSV